MLIDDEVVGAVAVWRNEVEPFNEREMAIVSAFAGQAALAINGLKLVQELQSRRAELARKVEELEALREVGEAVSSSLDVENVLATIAKHAVELWLRPTAGRSWSTPHTRALLPGPRGLQHRALRRGTAAVRPGRPRRDPGRAGRHAAPAPSVTDLEATELDPHTRILFESGWRSLVVVPMLREGQIVGSLVVRRKRTGDFSEETLDLLETFATHSALAI